MEQNPEIQEDLGDGGKFKDWLQDNIRIILSVLIVLAIAGGIYSYSKRTESPTNEELAISETLNKDSQEVNQEKNSDSVTVIGDEENQTEDKGEVAKTENQETEVIVPDEKLNEKTSIEEEINSSTEEKVEEKNETSAVEEKQLENQSSVSEESSEAFTETAESGDSMTTLARKALRNYLEKNNDSSLTAEHKIYIEDYLRKHSFQKSGVKIGDKISFSKTLIKDAIEKSKTLNENQLNYLKQYSSRVSNI